MKKFDIIFLFIFLGSPLFAQEIHNAAWQGDLEKVKTLLANDMTMVNKKGVGVDVRLKGKHMDLAQAPDMQVAAETEPAAPESPRCSHLRRIAQIADEADAKVEIKMVV